MNDTIELHTKGLDQLLKAIKNPPVVKVGILGSHNARTSKGNSNATIGARHEFGAGNVPQRSFLRIPIADNLQKYMDESQLFTKESLRLLIADGSLKEWMKIIGIIAENIVHDAFQSGGFGKWKQWKIPGYQNNTGMILVDTQQLRESISSEVK